MSIPNTFDDCKLHTNEYLDSATINRAIFRLISNDMLLDTALTVTVPIAGLTDAFATSGYMTFQNGLLVEVKQPT